MSISVDKVGSLAGNISNYSEFIARRRSHILNMGSVASFESNPFTAPDYQERQTGILNSGLLELEGEHPHHMETMHEGAIALNALVTGLSPENLNRNQEQAREVGDQLEAARIVREREIRGINQ